MPKKEENIRIFSEQDKQTIIDLYKSGVTKSQIRKIYKCRSSSITEILKGIHSDNIIKRKPIFSKNIENEICEMYLEKKYNKKFIAEKYGCCTQTITKILKNHNIKIENHKIFHQTDINLIEDFFHEINSEEKAYFLGFIFADGSIYNKNNCLSLEIHIKDIEIIYKLKELLNSNNKIKYRKRSNTELCSISIYSQKIVEDLATYGVIQNKTKITKHLPVIPEKYKTHFLRGLLDGDGWITIDKKGYYHVGFVTNFKTVAEDFKNLCNSLLPNKNTSKITTKGKNNSGFVCAFQSQEQVKQLMTALYKDSNVFLTRKKRLAEHFFNESNNDDDIV